MPYDVLPNRRTEALLRATKQGCKCRHGTSLAYTPLFQADIHATKLTPVTEWTVTSNSDKIAGRIITSWEPPLGKTKVTGSSTEVSRQYLLCSLVKIQDINAKEHGVAASVPPSRDVVPSVITEHQRLSRRYAQL